MEIPLSIDVFLAHDVNQESISYCNMGNWTAETEAILVQHLHDLLSAIKPVTRSLKVSFNIEVSDPAAANFMIAKVKDKCNWKKSQRLSIRENEVLGLIAQGFTNNEIAEKLFISFETVRSHRKNILIKSHAKNTASLINHPYLL